MMLDRRGLSARLNDLFAAQGKRLVVARTLGVSEGTLSRWVSGGNISLEHVVALCEKFDLSADWLLFGRKPKPLEVQIRTASTLCPP